MKTMKRDGTVTGLRPEKLAGYKRLHTAVSAEIDEVFHCD
jgi:hypothetical protein